MIEATALNKVFQTQSGDSVHALNNVNFSVANGEFFIFLGPSGSGKTTTLRTVAGIESADSGTLTIAGQSVFDSVAGLNLPSEVRPVSMVFQSYALWPHMNVKQNILFPLRKGVRRVSRVEANRRFDSIVSTLELGPYADRPISQLSGGQQQRVALARALVLEPSVLLMDEPLSNLDAKLRNQLRIEIKSLSRSLGMTTLYVTHDQEEAMVMGDRIAVMKDGAIVEEGIPRKLYSHPDNEFVATFLGDMNIIEGTYQPVDERNAILETRVAPLQIHATAGVQPGSIIRAGFRPESLRVAKQQDALSFPALLKTSHFLGEATLCEFEAGGQRLQARLDNKFNTGTGETVHLSLDPEDIALFIS